MQIGVVDLHKTVRYEPSHLDLHCLHRHLFWSSGLKRLTKTFDMFLISTKTYVVRGNLINITARFIVGML